MSASFPRIYGVLDGIRWLGDPLKLNDEASLRTASSKERFFFQDLIQSNQKAGRTFASKTLDRDACVLDAPLAEEALQKLRLSPENMPGVVESFLRRSLTLMRLFKPGAVVLRCVIVPHSNSGDSFFIGEFNHLPSSGNADKRAFYNLQPDEHDQLKEWAKLPWPKDLAQRPEVRWFNKAYAEPADQERLLHLVTGIEVILFKGDHDRSDLRHKFALRGAWMLGADYQTRRQVFRDLRKAYDLRLLVVHGSKNSFDRNDHLLADRTEEYLRRLISVTLSRPSDDSRTSIDDRILAGAGLGDKLPDLPPLPEEERQSGDTEHHPRRDDLQPRRDENQTRGDSRRRRRRNSPRNRDTKR